LVLAVLVERVGLKTAQTELILYMQRLHQYVAVQAELTQQAVLLVVLEVVQVAAVAVMLLARQIKDSLVVAEQALQTMAAVAAEAQALLGLMGQVLLAVMAAQVFLQVLLVLL
jgi:hypothetical protein